MQNFYMNSVTLIVNLYNIGYDIVLFDLHKLNNIVY